jgi:hypothetical protein
MNRNIALLTEKVNDLKARTKETNEELKLALEDTQVFFKSMS